MTTTPIAKPARSALDNAPEKLKPFLESIADRVGAKANWMVRKKVICDTLLALDQLFAMPEDEREALLGAVAETLLEGEEGAEAEPAAEPAADAEAGAEDAEESAEAGGDSLPFCEVLPFYVGSILELLNEKAITSVEQAGIYMLSIHPEHHQAAEAWLTADPRNAKAVRKLIRSDRRYRELTEMIEEHLATKDAEGAAL